MPISFVAFDMDGTLLDVSSSWAEVHRFFGDVNTEALQLFLQDRIDDQEFMRRDLALWRRHRPHITEDDLVSILAAVPLMPGAHELFDALHAQGIRTAIVSGGLDVIAQRIGRELGVDRVLANGFVLDGHRRLTDEGIIRVPIKRKGDVVAGLQREFGLSVDDCAAVGNSQIDVAMFERSRIGVAFLPEDEHVRRRATHVVTEKDLRRVIAPLTEEPAERPSRAPATG
ncbi:MAG TPA: HAD-IB family phosphatase [Thermoplasmata archaeon]|nr:HAD-IB family phosphatase [Thermoplasmata archaeon]